MHVHRLTEADTEVTEAYKRIALARARKKSPTKKVIQTVAPLVFKGVWLGCQQCCGSVMFTIPNPRSRISGPIFSIPDPGSRVDKIPYPGSGSAPKNLSIFDPKTNSMFSEIRSGIFIPESWILDLDFFSSRILDPGRIMDLGVKKAPNPVSRSATLAIINFQLFKRGGGGGSFC